MSSRQQTTDWFYGGLLTFLALLLVGFYLWLRFFVYDHSAEALTNEKKTLESLKTQQSQLLKPELRELFEQYSDGLAAVDSVFSARDEVFTGDLDPDQYEPVMLLDYPSFFRDFQKLLGKQSFLSGLSIDAFGRVSFLVQTTSYDDASKQMEALRFGLSEGRQRAVLQESQDLEELPPPLFVDVFVANITRQALTGKADGIPEFLRQGASVYSFIVQMRISPEYFFFLNDQKTAASSSSSISPRS